jgi:hypothetical protein
MLFWLWVHDDRFSKHDVVIHPDFFPNVKPGDLLKIKHQERSIIVQVPQETPSGQFQVFL